MKWTGPRARRAARFVTGALVASAVGLSTAASASAQSEPSRSNAPPLAIGRTGVPRGVTLERARAEAGVLGKLRAGVAMESSAALAPTGITALFLAPQHELVVIGTPQDDNIIVSRDAAGKLLVNGGA